MADMSWARQPNPRLAAEDARKVSDARKVLKPGDVIDVENRPVMTGVVVVDAQRRQAVL